MQVTDDFREAPGASLTCLNWHKWRASIPTGDEWPACPQCGEGVTKATRPATWMPYLVAGRRQVPDGLGGWQEPPKTDAQYAVVGVSDDTGERTVYFRAQANNQNELFRLIFEQAPRDHTTRILVGGAIGGGKTKCMIGAALVYSQRFPGSRIYCCRKDFTDLRDTFYADFVTMCPPGWVKFPRHGLTERLEASHDVVLHNGTKLMFRELKDVEGKLGLEVNLVVIEQCEEIEYKTYAHMESRLRPWMNAPESPRVMLVGANPNPGWSKELFYDNALRPAAERDPHYHYLHFAPEENTDLMRVAPNYVKDLEKRFPVNWVRRYLKGDWNIAVEGAIFPEYDGTIHEVAPFLIPRSWPRLMCLDPHLAKPFYAVYAAQCPDGPTFIYDELIGTPDQSSRDFFQVMLVRERTHWSGPVGRYHRLIDYSLAGVLHRKNDGETLREVIDEAGLIFENAKKVNKWENIMAVKELLKPESGSQPLLYVTRNCDETIWQMKNYRLHEHEPGTDWKEKILKERDDCCDCIQYLVAAKPWTLTEEVAVPPPISYAGVA